RREKVPGHRGVFWRPRNGAKKHKPPYEAIYTNALRKQVTKSGFRTIGEAKAWLNRNSITEEDSGPGSVTTTKVTVNEYVPTWLGKSYINDNSRRTYRSLSKNWVQPFIGRNRLTDIGPADIVGLKESMENAGKSNDYINSMLKALSSLFEAAKDDGKIGAMNNPVKALSRRQRRVHGTEGEKAQPVPPAERDALMNVTDGYMRLLIALAVYSGLRFSECMGLVWGDLHLSGDQPRIELRRQL